MDKQKMTEELDKAIPKMFRLWNKRHELSKNGEDLFEVNIEIQNVEYVEYIVRNILGLTGR